MYIKLIENVLPEKQFDYLSNLATGSQMPWFYVKNIADTLGAGSEHHSGYCHNMIEYHTKELVSVYAFTFLPILFKACERENINVHDVLQCRLFHHAPSLKPNIKNNVHIDLENMPHLVCLYYFNDSDGDTFFFDDKDNVIHSQTPKRNTAVIFDGNIRHCSSTPSVRRTILNIDFTVAFKN